MFNKIWWFIKLNYTLPIKLIVLPFLGIMYLMDLLFILIYRLEMCVGVKDYYDHSVFTVALLLQGIFWTVLTYFNVFHGFFPQLPKAAWIAFIMFFFILLCYYYGKKSDNIVCHYSQYTTAELFNWKRIAFLVIVFVLSALWVPMLIYESK